MGTTTSRLHVGIIPDGSRRWGRREGRPPNWDGAESGAKVEEILSHIGESCHEIDEVTIWALSTENLNRVDGDRRKVFAIVSRMLADRAVFARAGAKVRFLGTRLAEIPHELCQAIGEVEAETRHHARLKLNVGFGYGGREEILAVVARLLDERGANGGCAPFDAAEFERFLMVPRPLDMVIRTGGEQRLSGFMLYQVEYAELFFTPTLWPDFSIGEFDAMLAEFRQRERRFGK